MRRYLVVANQTLGSEELDSEIRRRMDQGECMFRLLVPMTVAGDYADNLPAATLGPMGAVPVVISRPQSDEEAGNVARQRLTRVLGELRALGAEVTGAVGDPDPLLAIQQEVDAGEFDEIVLSTLPAGISRWLGMDLPTRVERSTNLTVTTITPAEPG